MSMSIASPRPRASSEALQNKPIECRKRRLNEGSFVLLYFAWFGFAELFNVCIFCIFNLFTVLYFPEHPMCMHDTVGYSQILC